jgi:hypothetical protein
MKKINNKALCQVRRNFGFKCVWQFRFLTQGYSLKEFPVSNIKVAVTLNYSEFHKLVKPSTDPTSTKVWKKYRLFAVRKSGYSHDVMSEVYMRFLSFSRWMSKQNIQIYHVVLLSNPYLLTIPEHFIRRYVNPTVARSLLHDLSIITISILNSSGFGEECPRYKKCIQSQ